MATVQTPVEEAAERVAEGMPGLLLAAQAVALDDMRQVLHENRKRIVSDDKIYRRLIGMEDLTPKDDDQMGDIAISGDHHNHYHYESPPPAPAATPVAEKIKRVKSGLSGAAKAAVIASTLMGAGGLGAGALALLHYLSGDDAQATAQADAGARVRVFWGDEEIKPGEQKSAGVELKGESK